PLGGARLKASIILFSYYDNVHRQQFVTTYKNCYQRPLAPPPPKPPPPNPPKPPPPPKPPLPPKPPPPPPLLPIPLRSVHQKISEAPLPVITRPPRPPLPPPPFENKLMITIAIMTIKITGTHPPSSLRSRGSALYSPLV